MTLQQITLLSMIKVAGRGSTVLRRRSAPTRPAPVAPAPVAETPQPPAAVASAPLKERLMSRPWDMAQPTQQPEMTHAVENQITEAPLPSVFNKDVIKTPLGEINKAGAPDVIRRALPNELSTGGIKWKLPGDSTSISLEPSTRGFGARLAASWKF